MGEWRWLAWSRVGELWPREVDVGVAAVKIGSRDGRGEEEEKKSGVGGSGCFGWRWILGLGFPFFLYFSFKIAPSSSVLRRQVFIGKNVARFSNLVPKLLYFFVNLIFLVFLDFSCFFLEFSYQHRLEMRKIGDFKI